MTTPRQGEHRLPAAVATVAAIALYATLPNRLLGAPRLLAPGLEVVLLASLIMANPVRMERQNTLLRAASIGLTALVAVTNSVAFGFLVHELVSGRTHQGSLLLLAAFQVWLTAIISFALIFWELDRGGPVVRSMTARPHLPAADFRFPQDEDADTVAEVAVRSSPKSDWRPAFIDYFYVSITNSTAYSPTDTMPLSERAKLLMGLQSVEAIVISVLVIARAVSLLH
jgi:hypothetical protein